MVYTPIGEHNTSVNFVLMASFHTRIPVSVLRNALDRLKGRQRAFDISSSRDFHNPQPPQTGPYPLRVLSNCAIDDWQKVAASELAQPFCASDPRVRFVILEREQTADLLIVCDHSVSDALSGILFLQDLLELLNLPEKHLAPLPVPPPVWEVLPSSRVRRIQNKLRMAISLSMLDLLEWHKARQKIVRLAQSFQINSAELSSNVTEALLKRCREERTSIHAAICAAWLLALDKLDRDMDGAAPARRKKRTDMRSVSSPVNIRKWLAPEMQQSAGIYYTIVQTAIRCDPTRSFWKIAREIKQKMSRAENDASFYTMPLFFQSMYKRMTRLPEGETFHMPEPPITYDYSISNLGRIESRYVYSATNEAPYTIKAIYGPMVNAFRGEKTVGVCTLNGLMRFVFTTFVNELNISKARELTQTAKILLEDAARIHELI